MEKKNQLKSLIQRLHRGEDENTIKKEFKEKFGTVSSSQIAKLEQELIVEGMPIEEIQSLCNVHAAVFEGSVEDIHVLDKIDRQWGHPLFVFRKENEGIIAFIDEKLKPTLQAFDTDPRDVIAMVKELGKIDRHYSRKENLFFPYLEKKGVTGPPKVMWGKDDEVRALIKEAQKDELTKEERIAVVQKLIEEVESMVKKENEILSPLLLEHISEKDWLVIAESSPEIGFAFNGGIEGASPSDAMHWIESQRGKVLSEEVPEEEDIVTDGLLKFPSGKLTIEQMKHMMNTSPMDFTFIDENDNVLYFSEGKHPVFARTRTIIGRDVRNCHPPKAVPIVEQMLKDFKEGVKDEELRFVFMGSKVLSIRYFAVRDEEGKYVGTLETTEEISGLLEEMERQKRQ